jgi:hypothetical protein
MCVRMKMVKPGRIDLGGVGMVFKFVGDGGCLRDCHSQITLVSPSLFSVLTSAYASVFEYCLDIRQQIYNSRGETSLTEERSPLWFRGFIRFITSEIPK